MNSGTELDDVLSPTVTHVGKQRRGSEHENPHRHRDIKSRLCYTAQHTDKDNLASRQIDQTLGRQTGRQADRQTGRQTNRKSELEGRQTGSQAHRSASRQTG